jgi:hypothetical protein
LGHPPPPNFPLPASSPRVPSGAVHVTVTPGPEFKLDGGTS